VMEWRRWEARQIGWTTMGGTPDRRGGDGRGACMRGGGARARGGVGARGADRLGAHQGSVGRLG
jgi:hypothetical protein